uniref:Uncharacterized protein n=1 Tax=Salix viminalis TaxID=40686 RepID=A0A6N2JYA0_SALVM
MVMSDDDDDEIDDDVVKIATHHHCRRLTQFLLPRISGHVASLVPSMGGSYRVDKVSGLGAVKKMVMSDDDDDNAVIATHHSVLSRSSKWDMDDWGLGEEAGGGGSIEFERDAVISSDNVKEHLIKVKLKPGMDPYHPDNWNWREWNPVDDEDIRNCKSTLYL